MDQIEEQKIEKMLVSDSESDSEQDEMDGWEIPDEDKEAIYAP